MDDRVARGLALVRTWDDEELALATVVDRLEGLSSDPAVIRRIIDVAEQEGLLERAESQVQLIGQPMRSPEQLVVSRTGSFTCRRCGTDISEGYFLRFDTGDCGPFGSTCVRRVLGRE